jgi:hypothetical protein
MTIKHLGGIFGRNPTFEEVVVDDEITANKGNFVLNDAATNTVSYPLDVHHTTTGSATNGFGVGINFNLENTIYGITDDAAKIEVVSVSPGEIANNLFFKTKWNATLADRLVLRGRGGVAGVVDLDLIYGNLKVADGFGIDFSLTSGTGTSELLDDYEEGTWTPTVITGAASLTFVSATYTKVGDKVTVWAYVNSLVTPNSSAVVVGGLPFTSKANQWATGSLETSAAGTGVMRIDQNSTQMDAYRSGQALDALIGTDGASHLIFSVTYSV